MKDALKDIAERALNTFCQALLSATGVSWAAGVEGIQWWPVLNIAIGATVVSVLHNVMRHTKSDDA